MTRATALAIGMAALLWQPAPAASAPIPWGNEPISYTVVDQDLRDLLTEFGTRIGVPVRVSEAVKARVRGRLPPAPPREFLERLSQIYGLEWFYDGGTLWVTAAAEDQSKLLRLGPVEFGQLSDAMGSMGISDTRWPLRASTDAGLVMVNGPPRYVTMTEQMLQALQQRAQPSQTQGMTIFRGKPANPS